MKIPTENRKTKVLATRITSLIELIQGCFHVLFFNSYKWLLFDD